MSTTGTDMVCLNGTVMSLLPRCRKRSRQYGKLCVWFLKFNNPLCSAVWERFRFGVCAVLLLLLLLLLAVLCSAGVARGHPLLCGFVVFLVVLFNAPE